MAIALPYPGLTFVPLDKLTAEEMNEIVANYTAIANTVSATSFVDDKDTSPRTVTTGKDTVVQTLDISSIPTGAEFLVISQGFSHGGASSSYYYLAQKYNGNYDITDYGSGDKLHTATLITKWTKIANVNTVNLELGFADANGVTVERTYMSARVVG